MVILSQKLKNAINKANQAFGLSLEFHLKNITINGDKRGCSGFIKNTANGKVVYVNTETTMKDHLPWGDYDLYFLYREARHLKDYQGLANRWASFGVLSDKIINLLQE